MLSSAFTETELASLQLPSDAIAGKTFDILIVGAGPSGSAAAISLRRQGFSVALLDRARFPREKTCGDCLLPEAISYLRQLGLADKITTSAHPVEGLRVYSCGGVDFDLPANILTLKRSTLDTLMARAAVDAGAVFCLDSVSGIESPPQSPLCIQLGQSQHKVCARIVLIACGAQSALLKRLGVVIDSPPSAIAMRCYVRSSAAIGTGILSYDRSVKPGFAWIFPLGDSLFNIGCGTVTGANKLDGRSLRETFKRFTSSFPPAIELLRHGRIETPLRGFPIQCSLDRQSPPAGGRILAIGESAGTTYPFTGEGIAPAIRSALIASEVVTEALHSGDMRILGEYPHRLRREMEPRYRGYRKAERWLSVGWINDLVAARIRKSHRLQNLCAGIVAGTVNPSAVYSVRGLLKSIWS